MQGRLFTLLDVGFPSYFVLLVTGFVVATAMGALWAKRLGHDPDVIVDLGLGMLLAGVAGSRVLHVLADGYLWDYVHLCTDPALVGWKITEAECARSTGSEGLLGFFGSPAEPLGTWDSAAGVCRPLRANCWAWAEIWNGGFTYYGGLLGAIPAAWYLLRRDRFPFWRAADMAGMVVSVGLVFGRMGCLLAGCCFGTPTAQGWALSFPPYSPASESQFKGGLLESPAMPSLEVHPTQLYEAWGCLGIAAFLLLHLHGRKRYDGHVFVAFLAAYAVLRFVLEWLRSDDRGGLLGLSTSQLLGLALAGAAVYVHRWRSAEVARSPAPG